MSGGVVRVAETDFEPSSPEGDNNADMAQLSGGACTGWYKKWLFYLASRGRRLSGSPYGTIQRGEEAWRLLRDLECEFDSSVFGRLRIRRKTISPPPA